MFKFKAEIERSEFCEDGCVFVNARVVEPAVDRPVTKGWELPEKSPLVARLVRAIEAGAVLPHPEVKTDMNGKTFVSTGVNVRGRCLNADLKRLGF